MLITHKSKSNTAQLFSSRSMCASLQQSRSMRVETHILYTYELVFLYELSYKSYVEKVGHLVDQVGQSFSKWLFFWSGACMGKVFFVLVN